MKIGRLPAMLVLAVGVCAGGVVVSAGCGSDSDEPGGPTGPSFGDADGGDGSSTSSTCAAAGASCAADSECCSSRCDESTKTCSVNVAACGAAGTACSAAPECCTFSCIGGKCSSNQCTADDAACTQNEECCSGACTDGTCKPLTTACKSTGNPCGANGDCCSKYCKNGFCASPSYCAQTGDACSSDLECCGGSCDKADGAALGTCSIVGSAPCAPAGTVCSGTGCDNFCCSLSCGLSGDTGVTICQPPSGCKPQNELCRTSEDCCGGPGRPTGRVNGAGPGYNEPKTCTVPEGETFGRCDFLQCLRPGDVCKTTSFSCGGTSNNCCEGDLPDGGKPSPGFCNQNPDACCSQDVLGIPRCRAVNFKCEEGTVVPAGQKCATSADCCGKPCVNNACEGACVQAGGACSIDADCCSGLPCNVPVGSTKGTCGAGSGGSAKCSAYGQECSATQPCCNDVPCNDGVCRNISIVK